MSDQAPGTHDVSDVRALVLSSGEALPEPVRSQVLAQGRAAVPALMSILEDESLEYEDAPGEGYARIHAAELLGELAAEEAIPLLVQTLVAVDFDFYLHDALISALVNIGPAVAPAVMQALDVTHTDAEISLIDVLARCGARDEQIFERLCAYTRREPDSGPGYLADYGDARALPLLNELFDQQSSGLDGSHALIELENAVQRLGGTLTPAQQQAMQQARALLQAEWEEPLRQEPVRRVERPERNAPCWCGSGKKYKKCHLAEDQGKA